MKIVVTEKEIKAIHYVFAVACTIIICAFFISYLGYQYAAQILAGGFVGMLLGLFISEVFEYCYLGMDKPLIRLILKLFTYHVLTIAAWICLAIILIGVGLVKLWGGLYP